MNYGEDELGSFGDENEIKVSPRGFLFYLAYALPDVSIQMRNKVLSRIITRNFRLNYYNSVQSLIAIFSSYIFDDHVISSMVIIRIETMKYC